MKFQTSTRPWWEQVRRSVRAFPGDLLGVAVVLGIVNAAFRVPGLRETTIAGARLQALVGIPALLLVPGYVLVAIAFPADRDHAHDRVGEDRGGPRRSIDPVERAALSFGMSVALLPLFALVVGPVWGFSTPIVLAGFTVMIAVGVVLAAIQRLRVPPADRFRPSVRGWLSYRVRAVVNPDSPVEGIATVFLAVAVLATVGAAGYAVATPYQSGPSSTLYLVTENETGTHLASGYPTEFTVGERQSLTVGVVNDEERRQRYTVVLVVERVRANGTGVTVLESSELGRLHADVPAGETWTERHTVAPEMLGEDLRLHYYLYRGETAPSDPDPSSAYRDAYIWIDVSGS